MKKKRMCDEVSELVKEWHPTKNGILMPENVMCGSKILVWWRCDKGHEWKASISHRTSREGTGCPYCSGRYAITGENDLQTLFPVIAQEWNFEKNKDITPNKVKPGSSKKVWWKCKKGHEWQAIVYHRTKNNSKCPYCSGRYAIMGENDLQTLMPNIAKEWHPIKNKELLPTDVKPGSNIKVWWHCKEGHEWKAAVVDRTRKNGSNCPYCSGNINIKGKTDLQTLFPEIAAEFNNEKNVGVSPSELFAKSGKKFWWNCNNGHSWQASVISRTNLKAGCPFCAGQRPVLGENDLKTLRPDLALEWHPNKNRNFTPSDCTISSGRKIWWKCKKGHEWQSVVSTRTGKDNCGCPYCTGRYAVSGKNDLATLKPNLVKEWNYKKNKSLLISEIKISSNKRVWWICENGHEWKTSISSRTKEKGTSCPYCSGYLAIPGETDLATLNPKLAMEWHPTKNKMRNITKVTAHSSKKAWWICEKDHEWRATVNMRSYGSGCPFCLKEKK